VVGSIDGLASGLNTGDIISQHRAIERQGQTRLKTTQKQAESAIGALRTLNGRFLAIKTAAEAFTLPTGTGFTLMSATTSDATRATVTTKAGAAPGEVTFRVSQLATTTVLKSAGTVASSATVVASSDFVLTKDGTATTVPVGDGSLSSVVAGINGAKAGVTASAVQIAKGEFALQLTSTTSGASTIGIDGDPFTGTLGTVEQVTAGRNAAIQVGVAADGTGGYTVTRTSNTFDDLLPGTTISLLKQDAVPITVRTTADTGAIADGVAKLIGEINAAAAEISRTASYNSSTKTAGVLNAEGAVRSLRSRLSEAVTGTTTSTPGLVGISIQRDGTVLFDRAKFLKALETDPASVQAIVGKDGLAGRLAAVANAASAPTGTSGGAGSLTAAMSNREQTVRRLQSDIQAWDRRLELREQRLVTQFTSLEKAIGAARSQSQWLSGQLAGMNGG
jgi:flagellar hook-associated protein 2